MTNRGTNLNITSDYVLFNVTAPALVWNTKNLFDVPDNPAELKPFTPTIVNGKYYVTNSSLISDHSIVAFNFIDSGVSSILWTFSFTNPNYPTMSYDLGLPLYRNADITVNDMLILSLSPINPTQTNSSYLIALDPPTGTLLWTRQFPEPIIGYAACKDTTIGLYVYVSTTHALWAFRVIVTPPSLTEVWNVTKNLVGPISAPSVDKNGRVYICDMGKLLGYSLLGSPVIVVDHSQTNGNLCDQPLLLENSLIVRSNIGLQSNGILFAGLGPYSPITPPVNAADQNEIGMIVGICIGILFLLLIILVIIKFRRRRRGRHYNVLN
jgi:hypothetical protein